jgi:hypothetical protein
MATVTTVRCDHCGEVAHFPTAVQVKTAVYDDGTGTQYKTQPLDLCAACTSKVVRELVDHLDEKRGVEFLKRWAGGPVQ